MGLLWRVVAKGSHSKFQTDMFPAKTREIGWVPREYAAQHITTASKIKCDAMFVGHRISYSDLACPPEWCRNYRRTYWESEPDSWPSTQRLHYIATEL